jgi:hypothetical protein
MYEVLNILIIVLTFAITLGAQGYINYNYKKTKEIKTKRGMTGLEVARRILDSNGLHDVKVVETSGVLSDHYDPKNKCVRLSEEIYRESSIAAISVAAHECGHALQDKEGYTFLKVRNSIVPVVNFASAAGYIAILIGLFMGALGFIWIGIFLELIILFFQVITLPVEFNASSRALIQLEKLSIVDKSEKKKCFKMLKAAALTYVAAVATAILEIVRLILISREER